MYVALIKSLTFTIEQKQTIRSFTFLTEHNNNQITYQIKHNLTSQTKHINSPNSKTSVDPPKPKHKIKIQPHFHLNTKLKTDLVV